MMDRADITRVLEDAIAEEYVGQTHELIKLFCLRVFEAVIESRIPKSSTLPSSSSPPTPSDQQPISMKFGLDFPPHSAVRKATKTLLDLQPSLLDSPLIMLTYVKMPDADDLYLEAFWIALESNENLRQTLPVSDLYSRFSLALRSVIIILRTSSMRRLITREWLDTDHQFFHLMFSCDSALKNLQSLPDVISIFPIITPLGNLRVGCASRSHEIYQSDPWSMLHSFDHDTVPGILLDQTGAILGNSFLKNFRRVRSPSASMLMSTATRPAQCQSLISREEDAAELLPEIHFAFAKNCASSTAALLHVPNLSQRNPSTTQNPSTTVESIPDKVVPIPEAKPEVDLSEMNFSFASVQDSGYSDVLGNGPSSEASRSFPRKNVDSVMKDVLSELDRMDGLLADISLFCSNLDSNESSS